MSAVTSFGGCSSWMGGQNPITIKSLAGEESTMHYRLAYAVGFHPWEGLAEHPPYADTLLELVGREEERRDAPYGPALDIGTGSGVWGVRLAKRGWGVTGVDAVEKALDRARERASK